jgi:acetyl esterase/lipase
MALLSIVCLPACATSPPLPQNNSNAEYTAHPDVRWASPGGFDLTMDIYTPKSGAETYPVLMIFHGGGWLINDKSIMHQAAEYLATKSKYVICNVNYRLLGDNENSVTIDQIVGDVFGAVLWAQNNIGRYQGDPAKIAVTGDSSGGHLSAMIVNLGNRLHENGYTEQTLGFLPSYIPPGKTVAQIASEGGITVQAAILSYGAFDLHQSSLDGFETWRNPFWLVGGALPRGLFGDAFSVMTHPELYKGVSPLYNIPSHKERALPPQLLTAGSEDWVVPPASVQDYRDRLQSAGHYTEYWEYKGQGHAYLDSRENIFLGQSFAKLAPPALDRMIDFLDRVFAEVDRPESGRAE